jgi:hypothetical protein
MKLPFFLLFMTSSVILSCSTDANSGSDIFIIKVDSIRLPRAVMLGDTLNIRFYGTIGSNGNYSFDRFESSMENTTLNVTAWGKVVHNDVATQVMVYLDGKTYAFVPTRTGAYRISIHQPDASTLEDTVLVH